MLARGFLRPRASIAAGALLLVGLGWYYYLGATEHARVQNWFKARGDQSAYLYEAQILYRNWHGLNDPPIVQPRNRMPLYPAFLALFYDPRWSDSEFFDIAKIRSVYLSLALLAVIGVLAFRHLPPLAAWNFTLTVAFGYFIFKAAYVQSELLFYALNFAAFVAMWHALVTRDARLTAGYSVAAGALAALAHLTKASMLPLAAIFVAVLAAREIRAATRAKRSGAMEAWRTAAVVLFAASFLGVLYPYISTSKRVNRQYFYNLNTSLLMWYENYAQASVEILKYGPDGWPQVPRAERPGPRKYWRAHTGGQIADRFAKGFRDIVVRLYTTYWVFKYVVLYAAFVTVLAILRWRVFVSLVRRHAALAMFLMLYAAIYLSSIAFYEPISGTGTARFVLAHIAPLLFTISMLLAHPEFPTGVSIAGTAVSPVHFHILVSIVWALDLTFFVWPRLMTTYGGF